MLRAMFVRGAPPVLASILVLSLAAAAQADEEAAGGDGWATEVGSLKRPPDLSPEFSDPEATTRFHLTGRLTPTKTDLLWTIEAQAAMRLGSNVALTAAVPFGFDLAQTGAGHADQIFLGNVRIGVAGGGAVWRGPGAQHPTFWVGGAIDIYAPTSPPAETGVDLVAAAQTTLPLEPGLFMSRSMAFRARLHLGFDVSIVGIDAELGGTPAFTIGNKVDGYGWLSMALRVRVLPVPFFEPYLELGGTLTLGQPSLPRFSPGGFAFTPGVRFHFLGLAPAAFVTIYGGPSGRPDTVTIGLDFAGFVERSNRSGVEKFSQ
ncbi:MAG: hypothetical protein U1E65_12760 [Myxococcota bacterium]